MVCVGGASGGVCDGVVVVVMAVRCDGWCGSDNKRDMKEEDTVADLLAFTRLFVVNYTIEATGRYV